MRRLIVLALLFGFGCKGCDDDPGNVVPDAGPPDGPPVVEVVCEELPPLAAGTCEVTPGNGQRLLKGIVLTPSTVFRGGQVLVDLDGQIACTGCDCAVGGETVTSCPDGVISPGLINTHDHTQFANSYPYGASLYTNDEAVRYEDRQQWREGDQPGRPRIRKSGTASNNQVTWGELRFVLGGATSIVGEGQVDGLLRNLDSDNKQEGLAKKKVEFDTFPLDDFQDGQRRDGDCNYGGEPTTPASVTEFDAYEPHISEGLNVSAHNEFLCQSSDTFDTMAPGTSNNLVMAKTAIIHGVGFQAADFASLGEAGTALIWSPRSNVSLYGDTARVTVAARFGVEIALGTDWMPSGSMNMLRELKCAASLNDTYYNGFFTDEALWRMVTSSAAAVTATDDKIGTLAAGKVADISIFKANGKTYRAVIDAESADVAMVMRGGKVLYGDDNIVTGLAADAGACDAVDVCGSSKKLCLMAEIGQTYPQLLEAAKHPDGTPAYPAFTCDVPPDEPTCVPSRPEAVASSTVYTGVPSATDSDGDGIADATDNCVSVFNPVRPMDGGIQPDADGDTVGDACDACPLDADSNMCGNMVDPNDRDLDGVPNATDNCPDIANENQADADADGKGDLCDACPDAANPGAAGCPASIYSIKNGTTPPGTVVRVSNALVTGKATNGFFVQIVPGDTGFVTADFSGIFVFTNTNPVLLATIAPGKRVDIDGTVKNFSGQLELDTITQVIVNPAAAEAAPTPIATTYADVRTAGPLADELEGVLISLPGATVKSNNTAFGEYTLNDPPNDLIADDLLFVPSPLPTPGQAFASVTGILNRRQNQSKIEPRSAADLPPGAPGIKAFGPALTFKRQPLAGNTIPDPLTIELTSASPAGGTTVTLLSSNTNVATVPSTISIPQGATSIAVPVTPVAANATPVTIMATLAAQTLTADVRVLTAIDPPTSVVLTPATAAVAQGGTVEMTVTLNLPSLVTTPNVTISVIAGSATVPGTVDVATDKTTATFN
nr:amidohydrolase family protein [Deltaproteobacteria bacterium]